MKFTTIAVATVMAAAANAQVTFTNGSFVCAGAAKNADFCAGTSLSSNIIIRCTNGVGQPGNCNDNLAGIDPVGVKSDALCYQSSDVAGDAACSFNGTVYPDSGSPFKIGGSSSSSSSSAVASSYATATATSSVAPPISYSTSTSVTTASVTKPVTYSVPSTSATASTTAPVSPPVYTGAANSVKGGAAAVVMAAAAVVAFF